MASVAASSSKQPTGSQMPVADMSRADRQIGPSAVAREAPYGWAPPGASARAGAAIPGGGARAAQPEAQSRAAVASSSNGSVPVGRPGAAPAAPADGRASLMPTTAADLMREGPRDFTVVKELGDGSFGTVCLADWKSPLPSGTMLSPMQHPTTRPEYIGKRLVAIKRMKKPFTNWQECMKLKELKSLLAIPHHPNIIPLYDAFLMPTTKELHFVFESMEGNLYQLTKSRKGRPLAGGLVASIFEQIVHGLDHIHSHGYFHRDMKPENLLITTTGLADYPASQPTALPGSPPEKDVLVIVKLADFGLARETDSKPPYTEYVSTRWYRAPEVLLRSRDYSAPVDTWALGTIIAELVNLRPLFPGQSEVDQVMLFCDILGDPSPAYGRDERNRVRGGGEWEKGIKMAKAVGFQFPRVQPRNFHSLFNSRVPTSLVDCIQDLLRYDPKLRLTTADCLRHPYMLQDAPKLRPPQAKPVVSATAPVRRPPAGAVPINDRLAEVAGRRALPPSHSEPLSPHHTKPPFGAATDQKAQVNGSGMAPLHRVPFYAQQQHQAQAQAHAHATAGPSGSGSASHPSPMQEEPGDIPWASGPGQSHRESTVSSYPAFPDSASTYAGSHASMQFDGYPREALGNGRGGMPGGGGRGDYRDEMSDAQMTEATLRPDSRGGQLRAHQHRQYQQQQQQQPGGVDGIGSNDSHRHVSGRTVYDDDLTLAYGKERSARQPQQAQATSQQRQAYASAQHQQQQQIYAHQADHGVASRAAQQAAGMVGSSSELSQQNDSNASNETIGSREKERRRSKGWGLHIFGGGGGGGNSNSPQSGSANSSELRHAGQGQQGLYGQQTPAQKLAAEHQAAPASVSPSSSITQLDPKKAKKEAERAAKEAEKARREAQQKAARDRARAVIQKRNQLLASSNTKEAVEWLSGTVQTDDAAPRAPGPSEKARGKQPVPPGMQLSPSVATFPSNDYPHSPLHAQHSSQPTSPDFAGRVTSPAMASNMAWRGVGGPQYSRSSKARRRGYDDDHSMSSFEDAMDPRRISVQSYATGDSDPGPVNRQQLPVHNRMQRANSSSSLASASAMADPRRFAPSANSHRSSQETRSISSLDHQLITNMENMTAAEARSRTPGNVSPGPVHLVGSRQSVSRQSRANSRASSASAHRQGSASPLHHASGIPRFHPYSHGAAAAGASQGSAAYHQGYQLPPLHQALPGNGQRDPRGGMGSAEGTQLAPLAHLQHQQHHHQQQHGPAPSVNSVNPIFQVPHANAMGNGGGGSGGPSNTTLPPFSQIAASVDANGGLKHHAHQAPDGMFYGSPHHYSQPSHMQQG
ncbi:related to cdk-related kinase 1 [Pseudozyma flocculosa]|nr:related to cdk-related kinase 1 [Pseudozyma flocculosa]